VVDNTPALAAIAADIPSRLAGFADVLAAARRGTAEGPPPFHIAFIPGTLPSTGCLPPPSRAAACGVAAPDQFAASDYCGTDPNFTGPASDTFGCLGGYGAGGCGTFQPLEAARRALADAAQGGLAGRSPFFTPGDALVVIVVAGQDDASTSGGATRPVADYVSELAALAPNAFIPVVIGPPGCPDGGPIAPVQVPRLAEFASLGGLTSVCDASFNGALTPIFGGLSVDTGRTCLKGVRDMDPAAPGLQPSCVTQDDVTEADGTFFSASLPLCDASASVEPCLSLVQDPLTAGCWIPRITRPPDRVAACGPQATRDRVTCAGCTDPSDPSCQPPG
jgi:hypothetical protein